MKKLLSAVAILSLMVPSVASAATAAQSLSIKNAAVKPVRAAEKAGVTKAVDEGYLIGGLLVLIGVIAGVLSSGDDSR